jgi:hypothetical protein
MNNENASNFVRRDFLKLAGAAAASGFSRHAFAYSAEHVLLIVDGTNPVASSGPVKRAVGQLQQVLSAKGVTCSTVEHAETATGNSFCVVVAAVDSPLAKGFPKGAMLAGAESLRMAPGKMGPSQAVLVAALDPLGFVYGLLDLCERVRYGLNPVAALHLEAPVEEKPANDVRCISRYFCSELEDKPWYDDKNFWGSYLDTLVASRFNRFTLGYGLEYDFPKGVTDDYLHLPYPYLFDVPGHPNVRVMQRATAEGKRLASPVPLSKAEQAKNYEMLRFIAAETRARGLHFQLGIWTHAYEWTDSPNAYHHIDGLTPETHASYCRDALAIILKDVPEIEGLTMRVHGESGIPEGNFPFWKTLFEAIAGCGRKIEIDMHAKGVNQTMIDIGTATGMPIKLGAKYSAEHQSLGYQQTDIRALEIPHANLTETENKLFSLSSGSRSFTRYGYADFLREGAPFRVLFRSWPGTQRHLLSVDPEMAAACSRTSSLCGAAGLDLMEPLTFKGREGSGVAGGRCAYADASLNPQADWQKYEYYYRVWGHKLYNPDADPETWRRYLKAEFGPGAIPVETSLANATRILALLTSAHLDSASNHDLWYEMYTNMPIVEGSEPSPYGDTPVPKVFSAVSPLDPQMFSTVAEHTKQLLGKEANAKYSPIEVAQWVEDCVATSRASLAEAQRTTRGRTMPEFRRIEEDILIQTAIGTFFEHKLRSGVLYEIFRATGSPEAGRLAVEQYQQARDAWAAMAERAGRVYKADVSYGDVPKRRGHWRDRLSGIDTDLAAMKAKVSAISAGKAGQDAAEAIRMSIARPKRMEVSCTHNPLQSFTPGQPLSISLAVTAGATSKVKLHYRHVNQAERWQSVETAGHSGRYEGTIPSDYTHSEYSLEYYFELSDEKGGACMYPGFNKTLSNQPYFAVHHRTA